jgi:ABC-type lipoprotein export system ATPase subunit
MVLKLESVGKIFTRGKRLVIALDQVSLTCEDGDCIAIYGSSRSGKSTLLRLAAGREMPTSGSVLHDGQELRALSRRRRSSVFRSVAWVPASLDFQPRLNVLEQVALSPYLESHDYARSVRAAREALSTAGIEHCADAEPSELSDGELRLTGIAQAIVKRPRLLLADEPATNLDPMERDRVLDLLRACAQEHGAAVLFSATHGDETRRSTWLVRLDAGRMIVPSEPPPRGEIIDFPSREGASGQSHA